MSKGGRYGNMGDEELESLIRGLPKRQPRASLRERVLLGASRSRPALMSQPGFALVALALLLAADVLVVGLQGGAPAMKTSTSASSVVAEAPTEEDEDLVWLREGGGSAFALRVALRQSDVRTEESCMELRARLLEETEGG